ncbi:RNA and export factor binding protein 2 [Loa loa]|uniref:RNA and export factor binding protein 2 n=1 Tax=Loa loa TaxID=7209 RepID=A0A1S0U460_LOALO|nr:RNA and export factor binding protein 2 [Loa loa]EFO24606.1 RNA and export factor binding protein 2 [Loa loa]
MSVNDLISLSLDEIIARGGPKFRTNRRPGTGIRGFRGGVRRIPVITSRRPKGSFRLNNLKRDGNMCIVNISNLGPMVTTTDLQELFAEHPYEDVAVQYEPDGNPSGTAVVIFKRFEDGMKLKRQFTGVRLDGKVMDLFVLTKNDFMRGVAQGRITKRGTKGGIRFGSNNLLTKRRRGGFGRLKNTTRKPQVTSEELDRELDAYMRGSKHPKVSAP